MHQFRPVHACGEASLPASFVGARITGGQMRIDKPATDGGAKPPASAPQAGLLGACTSALGRMAASLRELGSARGSGEARAHRTIARQAGSHASPQLSKLTTVVESAAHHVERAEHCHRGAGVRIDAALYDLEQLRMELGAIVDPALLQTTSRPPAAEVARREVASGAAAEPPSAPPTAGRAGSTRSAA